MLQSVVQIYVRSEDDTEYDGWYDICLSLVPKDDIIHRVLKMFDRVGDHNEKYVLCWPKNMSEDDGLSKEELTEMYKFDPTKYKMYEPKPDKICIIKGRYVIKSD